MKKNNKKGFTLAELLIVVAIIAVLVAIAIPVFSTALEKSREAVDAANLRAAYAEVLANHLTGTTVTPITVTAKQTVADWATSPDFPDNFDVDDPGASGAWTVDVDVDDTTGDVSVTATFA